MRLWNLELDVKEGEPPGHALGGFKVQMTVLLVCGTLLFSAS